MNRMCMSIAIALAVNSAATIALPVATLLYAFEGLRG